MVIKRNRIRKIKQRSQVKRNGTAIARTTGDYREKIPAMFAAMPHTVRFRYQFLAPQLDTVSGSVLLSQIVVATSATATTRILGAVRIREIEMWAPGGLGTAGGGTSQIQVALEWFGITNSYQNSEKVSDVSMGIDNAHLLARPPRGSTPDFWINQGGMSDTTNTLFSLNGPLGTVVDLVMDIVLVDDEAASAGPTLAGGMTTGTVYYNYLDGRSSGNIQPFSGVRALP